MTFWNYLAIATPLTIIAITITGRIKDPDHFPRWWPWTVYTCTVVMGWRTWMFTTHQPPWAHAVALLVTVPFMLWLMIMQAVDLNRSLGRSVDVLGRAQDRLLARSERLRARDERANRRWRRQEDW